MKPFEVWVDLYSQKLSSDITLTLDPRVGQEGLAGSESLVEANIFTPFSVHSHTHKQEHQKNLETSCWLLH